MQFEGYIQGETHKAFLFWCHYWQSPGWMPKSQIDTIKYEDTHEVLIIASPWICDKKGLNEFTYMETEER